MLVRWVAKCITPFGTNPKIRVRKFSPLNIFDTSVLLTSLLYHFSLSTVERTRVIPSRLLIVSWRNTRFRSLCTCTQDIEFTGFFKSFLITTSALAFLFGDYSPKKKAKALVSDLFIYSILIFSEPFNYATLSASFLLFGELSTAY